MDAQIRKAVINDIGCLIEFSLEEAKEAEKLTKASDTLRARNYLLVKGDVHQSPGAGEMKRENGLELRLYVHKENRVAIEHMKR
jgi:hypothetical protein